MTAPDRRIVILHVPDADRIDVRLTIISISAAGERRCITRREPERPHGGSAALAFVGRLLVAWLRAQWPRPF